eukprot:366301-Chlamydomonas_euryale.AAC.33
MSCLPRHTSRGDSGAPLFAGRCMRARPLDLPLLNAPVLPPSFTHCTYGSGRAAVVQIAKNMLFLHRGHHSAA